MSKLTDTQLVILSAAARRDDRAVLPVPRSIKAKGEALTNPLEGLIRNGLIEEKPATGSAAAWRDDDDGQRIMLVVTEQGLQAIDGKPTDSPARNRSPRPRTNRSAQTSAPKLQPRSQTARKGTKQALLVDFLKRKRGASLAELVAATNWQPHSVRGAISGSIKKNLGLVVTSQKDEKRGRVYRIVEQG